MEANRDHLNLQRRLSSALRVWRGPPHANGVLCGTAFLIEPTVALTALHVVEDHLDAAYFLQATWNGGFTISVASIEAHNGLDAALLKFDSHAAAPESSVLRVSDFPDLNLGDPIVMIGFADVHSGAEAKFGRIQGFDGIARAPIAGPYPARGMSGGPVLASDGVLAGINWARDVDKGRGYIIPIGLLAPFLAEHGVRLAEVEVAQDLEENLRCYRTTDILDRHENRSHELSKLCAKFHHDPSLMIDLVELANKRRMDVETHKGAVESKIVSFFELPPPESVPAGTFWSAALANASVKSPRMLASLLITALGSQPLSKHEKTILLDVLNKLKTR